jgi:hypothetical protein
LRRAEEGAKIFGVIRVKNHDFTPKIIFFPILGGGGGRRLVRPPLLNPPLHCILKCEGKAISFDLTFHINMQKIMFLKRFNVIFMLHVHLSFWK